MQLLVLQSLQRTARLLHPSHAEPTLVHSFPRAQRTDRFAPGVRLFSLRVLFAFTSLVTVEGLVPASLAIFRAESPLPMPSSMITLLFVHVLPPAVSHRCLPSGGSQQQQEGC